MEIFSRVLATESKMLELIHYGGLELYKFVKCDKSDLYHVHLSAEALERTRNFYQIVKGRSYTKLIESAIKQRKLAGAFGSYYISVMH